MIKYKGHTANLLSDLSLALGHNVDLKRSELVLGSFFQAALNKISMDKNIELLSLLPSFIKPFCQKRPEWETSLKDMESGTTEAIIRVLTKYIPAETLPSVYACFPPSLWDSIERPAKNIRVAA